MDCHISNQIAEYCDEPEAAECPTCYSELDEYFHCDVCGNEGED